MAQGVFTARDLEPRASAFWSAERLALREATRRFAIEEVLPLANELDPVKGDIPPSIRDRMGELGYFGITIPQEYGGLGLGAAEYCIVSEQLSRAWLSVGSLLARGNNLIVGHSLSAAQKAELLPKVATGEKLCAVSLSEPDVGSDLASVATRAEKVSGGWEITGNKYWCTYADVAEVLLVLVRTSAAPLDKPYRGLSILRIDKESGSFPQGCVGTPIPKVGYFGWKTWELRFDKCFVPADGLVGEEGQGFKAVAQSMEEARLQTAARANGLALGALESALEYSQQRRQFNRPIGEFQAIRFKLAEMFAKLKAAQAMTFEGCDLLDRGEFCATVASAAKYFATQSAEWITSEALQVLGGAGYTDHHAVHRHWRDARLTRIFEGSSEIQLRIISDALLGKPNS